MLEHSQALQNVCFVGTDFVASISAPEPSSQEQDLIVSKVVDGSVEYQTKVKNVASLVSSTRQNGIYLQKKDKSVEFKEFGAGKNAEDFKTISQNEEESIEIFLGQLGPGLPNFEVKGNYRQTEGHFEGPKVTMNLL